MRVLGIDPGNKRLGWSIVDAEMQFDIVTEGASVSSLDCPHLGVIEYEQDPMLKWYVNFTASIHNFAESFPRIIQLYNPNEIAAEIVPAGKLGSNSEKVISAITVCKVIAFQFGLPWTDYGANTIKDRFTGDGLASKAQMKNEVFELFPKWKENHKAAQAEQKEQGVHRPTGIPQDAWDAVGAAVCHLRSVGG
jgi:Holliday junction resolvasome RuvABC endonuclease subunit